MFTMSSASKDIWKTLNEAKRKQDEIRSRLSSYESDDDSDDDEDEGGWVQRSPDKRGQERRPAPQEQEEQAPKKKPKPPPPPPPPPSMPKAVAPPPAPAPAKAPAPAPAPAPPRNPGDTRRLDFDEDSEPDYYGFNDSSSDEGDTSKPPSDQQVKRNSSKPMTAEEAVNLVKGLRQDNDIDVSESNHDDSQRHMMQQQQKQGSQRRTSSDDKDDSSSPMTAEEAIKLCMKQNRDDGAMRNSNFNDNEDGGDDDGNAGGYFDEEEDENSFGNRNSGRYNTAQPGGGSSRGSSKWKKKKGDNSNMADWGNNSDTTFATTFTSTQKAHKYGLYNQDDDTDHDDDEGFYDALQDPVDEGSYDRFSTGDGTKRKSLSSVKEEEGNDDRNAGSSGKNKKTQQQQDGDKNWGRRLSNMAMGVFNSKEDGDIEEGGQVVNRRASAGGMNPFQALSSTVTMASSVMANIGSSMNKGGEDGGDNSGGGGSGGGQGMAANMMNVFGRKPKNPPKQLKAPSRELEIIRKCQEQMKQREIEEREKEANAAKEDLENLRLRKEEEDARNIVKEEVERYRQTMIDMGNEDKLAKEGKAAADEYDDRLAMEDTLKEQEAKAKAMQENMQKIDNKKPGDDSDSDSDSDDDEEEGGCCSRLCACFCCLLKYLCVLIVLIVLVGVPLYFFSNTLDKIPFIPTWDEVKGGGEDGSDNTVPLVNSTDALSNLTATIVPTALITSSPTPAPTVSPTMKPVTSAPTASPTNTTDFGIVDDEVDISDLIEDPQRNSIAGTTNDKDEPEEDANPEKDAKPDKAKPENRRLRTRLRGKK